MQLVSASLFVLRLRGAAAGALIAAQVRSAPSLTPKVPETTKSTFLVRRDGPSRLPTSKRLPTSAAFARATRTAAEPTPGKAPGFVEKLTGEARRRQEAQGLELGSERLPEASPSVESGLKPPLSVPSIPAHEVATTFWIPTKLAPLSMRSLPSKGSGTPLPTPCSLAAVSLCGLSPRPLIEVYVAR